MASAWIALAISYPVTPPTLNRDLGRTPIMLAEPNAQLAERVRDSFATLAIQDALQLVRVSYANGRIDATLADELKGALEALSPELVRSEFYFVFFEAVDAFSGGDADLTAALRTLGECVRDAGSDSWLHRAENLRLRGETRATAAELQKYSEQTLAISRLDPRLSIPQHVRAGVLEKFELAVDLMAEISPEQAAEVNVLTEYVVPLEGEHFVGGSDITLFGASFLCLDESWSALCFADHLIHEASHQLLHARQEEEALLLNRDEINDKSPIRADPRPLYGSFHATFVFLRLARFMSAVVRSERKDLHDEATIRLHRHLIGLLQGLAIIRDTGVLTDAGQEEFDSWIDGARELVRLHGEPQAEIYLKLDWDYDVANPALPVLVP